MQLEKIAQRSKTERFPGVSMEPSDGYKDWCECEACLKSGSPSDRLMMLTNELARAILKKYKNGYVWILAYNKHAFAPDMKAEKNVNVTLCNGHLRGGATFSELIKTWPRVVTTPLGVYNYWGVHPYFWGKPNSIFNNPQKIKEQFAEFKAGNIRRFHSIVSRDSGVCGLGMYYITQLLWNQQQAVSPDALKTEFCRNMFGKAADEMRKYLDLIFSDNNDKPEFSSILIGRMYRILDNAKKLSSVPIVQKRINAFVYLTRYLEILKKESIAKNDTAAYELFSIAVRASQTCLIDEKATLRDLCRFRRLNRKQRIAMTTEWNNKAEKLPKFDLSDNVAVNQLIAKGIKNNPVFSIPYKKYPNSIVHMELAKQAEFVPQLGVVRSPRFMVFPNKNGKIQDLMVRSGLLYPENGPGKWKLCNSNSGKVVASGILTNDNKFHPLKLDTVKVNNNVYSLSLDDYSMGSQIKLESNALVWLPDENDNSFSVVKGGGKFLFFVPKGIKKIAIYGSCNAFFSPLAAPRKRTRIKINEEYAVIPVNKFSGQPWLLSCTGKFSLKFLNIPSALSLNCKSSK